MEASSGILLGHSWLLYKYNVKRSPRKQPHMAMVSRFEYHNKGNTVINIARLRSDYVSEKILITLK